MSNDDDETEKGIVGNSFPHCVGPLLIAGDFNIHVDVPGNADSVCLKELLESMGLQQHVNVPTHESGHTLDLIITRQCDSLLANIPVTD